ncbi:MAG: FecR domain-containing protein [Opitutae bacterium]|nr:FecR domain-containing protein [Opitutae bacterium]
MKPHSEKFDPAADEQAALWAAKLDGSVLTADERTALDAWLEAAPSHRIALAAYCQFSADLEQQLPLLAGIQGSTAETNRELTTARPRPWLSRPLWVGAMLTAAAAAVAVTLWVGRAPRAETLSVATASAERHSVALADGTRVELNAHTQLSATLGRDERRVRLSGQAFFAVAKDPSRPFFVETTGGTVRVTGTQFDVRTDAAAPLQVTVLEGSVQVQPAGAAPDATRALKAGDQYRLGEVHALGANEIDAVLAWRNGEIVFNRAPLRDVLAAFAKHHDRAIAVSPAAGELKLGGRFNLDDLPKFLELLPQAVPQIIVKRDAHGTVQVSLRDER